MKTLIEKKCQGCEGEAALLSLLEIQDLLKKIPGWKLSLDNKMILREFYFKNYYQTMAFVNMIAWVSHQENHHPDLVVSYNKCMVQYTTHAIEGLTENDFICAAKINESFST